MKKKIKKLLDECWNEGEKDFAKKVLKVCEGPLPNVVKVWAIKSYCYKKLKDEK